MAPDSPVTRLGRTRLHSAGHMEVILIPTPSDDPNDPLRWYVLLNL